MKKAVITDLDGTLIDDFHKISDVDLLTLKNLKGEFLRIIATGKSLYSYLRTFKQIPDFVDYMIFSNGSGVLDCKKNSIIDKKQLCKADVEAVAEYLSKAKYDFMIQAPLNHEFMLYCYKKSEYKNLDFFSRIDYYKDVTVCNEAYSFDGAVQVLAVIPLEHWNSDLLAKLKDKFPMLSVIKSTSPMDKKSIWIEFCNVDVSKAKTLKRLSKDIGFNLQNSLVVGNDFNDVEMLNLTSYNYVTENCPKPLKNMGFTIVDSNNNSGVSEAVQDYLYKINKPDNCLVD